MKNLLTNIFKIFIGIIIILNCSYAQTSYTSQVFPPDCDTTKKETLYLIPGQGADWRSYQFLDLADYDTVIIPHLIPHKNETLPEYAKRMSAAIDTTETFSLIGVSFGGMICVEISKFLNPHKVIIISSAKGKHELPFGYPRKVGQLSDTFKSV